MMTRPRWKVRSKQVSRMKCVESNSKPHRLTNQFPGLLVFAMLASGAPALVAQGQDAQVITQQIQDLKSAVAATQAQLEQSQRQLEQMKQQLNALEVRVAQSGPAATSQPSDSASGSPPTQQDAAKDLATAVEDLREQQSMQAAQIATHDQTKLESESRYPVKITG